MPAPKKTAKSTAKPTAKSTAKPTAKTAKKPVCKAPKKAIAVPGIMDGPMLRIRGAREHNLKNVDIDLPRDKLVVITGLSGSGKSSLAFDTIYAEGQRRYVESLSAYARQFLELMQKPDVDSIEGLTQSALYRRHSDRDLRLYAASFRQGGYSLFPGHRPAD